jgi:hypothetical protein
MTLIYRTEREQVILKRFYFFLDLTSVSPKNSFWPYFRGLNQNVSPPWIYNLHIRNLDECAAEECVKVSTDGFVRSSSSVFYILCVDFPKVYKFQLILYTKYFQNNSMALFWPCIKIKRVPNACEYQIVPFSIIVIISMWLVK